MTEQEILSVGEWFDFILTHGSKRHAMAREVIRLALLGHKHEAWKKETMEVLENYAKNRERDILEAKGISHAHQGTDSLRPAP